MARNKLLTRLANEFHFGEEYLLRLIRSAPLRYKVYQIEKRQKGKYRTIAQPAVEVKMLQYYIIENYLKDLPIHSSAKGYVRDQNIKKNVAVHAKNQFLLKMDFIDFFPSIKPDDLFSCLTKAKKNTLQIDDYEVARDILFWHPKSSSSEELQLSIGAPSSPIISNLVMFEFDDRVTRLCKNLNVEYTRYADDLTFSTNERHILENVREKVEQICAQWKRPALRINPEKTVFSSKRHRRRITGLIVSNEGEVSLGRDRKRLLRAQIHHFKTGKLDKEDILHLKGMLAFAMDVEPGFVKRMRNKYGFATINEIMKTKQRATEDRAGRGYLGKDTKDS